MGILKFNHYLEAINNPPHLPVKFFRNHYEEFKRLETSIQQNLPVIKLIKKYARDLFGSRNSYTLEDAMEYIPHELKSLLHSEHGYNLSDRIKYILDAIKNEENNMLRVVKPSVVDDFDASDFLSKMRELYRIFPRLNWELAANVNDLPSDPIPDANTVKMHLTALRTLSQDIIHFLQLYKNYKKQVSAWFDLVDRARRGESKLPMPKHEKIETLYHATAFVREVLEQGFKTRKELQTAVLGGGTDKAISFTSNPDIALSIAESIKVMINIAQGKIGWDDVMNMAREDNVSVEELEELVRKSKRIDKNKPEDVAQAYHMFLFMTRERYNPVFWGLDMNVFSKMDVNNVGVVSASVEMADAEYLSSMEEYRVNPEAITDVKVYKSKLKKRL